MKKGKMFYGVTTKFYDDKVTSSITHHLKSPKRPRNEEKPTAECDIYLEWFTSRKEAEETVKIALRFNDL